MFRTASAQTVATAQAFLASSSRVVSRRAYHASEPSKMARILCSDPIDKICVDVLASHGHEVDQITFKDKKDLLEAIKNYEGLIVRSGTQVTKDVIAAADKLKLIGRAGTGTDNIDVSAATRNGVLVMNTPGGNTLSAAELTMALIMSLMRNIPQADASVKSGKWDRKTFMGRQLSGKTIGIVGLGRIGREVARWCQSFGMNTIGYDPILSETASKMSNITPVTLDELYARSDIITLHVPLSADTKNLINKESIDKMKPGVRIVNCARGGVIDEEALRAGLDDGKIAGVALDVYRVEPPSEETYNLISHPKIIATPHLGASTKDAQVRVAHDIAQQFVNALAGKEFVGVVNAPNIDFARRGKLLPYLDLGEKIGSMQAQMLGGEKLKKIYIIAQGKNIATPEMSEVLKTCVVKGVLSNLLEEEVNFINAVSLAEDMGLSVEEQRKAVMEGGNYGNLLTVVFETERGQTKISGTVYGDNQLRLVEFDDFKTDIHPGSEMLIFRNDDKPGVLREVTSILASSGINIESFEVGRTDDQAEALSFITLDDPVPEEVSDKIRELPAIHRLRYVQLMDMPALFSLSGVSDNEAPAVHVSGSGKPSVRPANPEFSSGPCKKRPGYNLSKLNTWCLGRSHRSKLGKSQLHLAIEESKRILGLPQDYLLGIVPASDTGAFEMAMWSMLGERPVDVCYWESFGKGWFGDITTQLKLPDVRKFEGAYGQLPELEKTNPDHDIIFTWNGTTSGVKLPNGDWISDDRKGLTFNDATSAAFAMDIPWPKVDVTTYSWQKVLGGEGGHGVLVLSPRAVERLETYTPDRPLPKIFRMVKKGKVDKSIFEGSTINTPSMLCVEDYLDALRWADSIGGLQGLISRSQANFDVLDKFVKENDWIDFLAKDPASRSNTSVCLTLDLPADKVKTMVSLLEKEGVALDIGSYRDAPPGLRIWCGATVEKEDLEALTPWLTWAYNEVSK